MKFKGIKVIKERLSGFYYIVKEIATVIFKVICTMTLLTITVSVFILIMTDSPLKTKSYAIPSENAKIYELIKVEQSKDFFKDTYYDITYKDENGIIYENNRFYNNETTNHMVVGDENKYVTENHSGHEYIWLYLTEETLEDVLD